MAGKRKQPHQKLPNTDQWQPRRSPHENLADAFLRRCNYIEEVIKLAAQFEIEMILDYMDAGPGIEDMIRQELQSILPDRYAVGAGTIIDTKGFTSDDNDVIIYNPLWFPLPKIGITPNSRQFFYPIESVYGVVEVKQAIDFNILEKAMEKLVKSHRLYRPTTSGDQITENVERPGLLAKLLAPTTTPDDQITENGETPELPQLIPSLTTNPLYSAIIATKLSDDVKMEDLVERFFHINKKLKRKEMVRALCVLGHGTVVWGRPKTNGIGAEVALFMDDLDEDILPVYFVPQPGTKENAFYALVSNLLEHLYHSILDPKGLHIYYSGSHTSMPLVHPDLVIPGTLNPAEKTDPTPPSLQNSPDPEPTTKSHKRKTPSKPAKTDQSTIQS